MFRRAAHIFVFIIMLGMTGAPAMVQAQLDPRCWAESECITARQNVGFGLSKAEAAAGHYRGPDATSVCGETKEVNGKQEKLGFCLPIGETVTGIGIGGQAQFENLGTYIQYVYRYGILAAAILSVVMIIVAGLQWTMSGGNSSTIDSAKKRIAGAVAGLFLAVISYTILNQVNPNLVNFRLPQIWMINQSTFPVSTCDQIDPEKKVAAFADFGKPTTKSQREAAYREVRNFPIEGAKADCGTVFFIEESGGDTCHGVFCEPNHACYQLDSSKPPTCIKSAIGGNLYGAPNFFERREVTKIVDNGVALVALCNNGHTELASNEVDAQATADGNGQYYSIRSAPRGRCSGDGGVLGYYLAAEVNDKNGVVAGIGPSEDDWFAVGHSPTNKHACNVNLSKWVLEKEGRPSHCNSGSDEADCSCEGIADYLAGKKEKVESLKEELKKFLFTQQELDEGIKCDLHLDRTSFPDIDNSVVLGSCDE